MANNCKVIYGIDNACADLLQASGVDKDFWVFYISDLSTRISLAQTGPISTLSFLSYMGLVKFSGQKFAHKADSELMVAAGGSISYTHKAMVKLMSLNTTDDVELQRLSQATDLGLIIQDNNENFFIYGPSKGLSAVAGPIKTTGQAAGEDTSATLNFLGNEKVLPLRFDRGSGVTGNISYLDGLIR